MLLPYTKYVVALSMKKYYWYSWIS